jgi:signal transduction histidine kinase
VFFLGDDPARMTDRFVSSARLVGTDDTFRRHPALVRSLREAIETGASVRLSGSTARDAFRDAADGHALIENVVCVPLANGAAFCGGLVLANKRHAGAFDDEDVETVEAIVMRAGNALQIAHLSTELRRAVTARNSLLAVVSHDMRSPLSAVQLSVDLLAGRDRADDRRKNRRQIDVIERATGRMRRLIDDLLQAASIEAGTFTVEPAMADLGSILDDVVAANEQAASRRSIQFEQSVGPLPAVRCDRERVAQVLSNLVDNAIQFVTGGGTIRLSAHVRSGAVQIAVTDTGPGIAAEQIAHLFDRYWKGKASGRHGFGLGLYIAKGIVDAHGGRMWVESEVGRGTTFYFTIPISDPREQDVAAS